MKLSIFILSLASIAFASTKSIVDYAQQAGKYLVISKPIVISSGDTLIVPQGREVLFSNLSGITVSSGGFLSAVGTKDQPVYFTSLLDTAGSASAFDWNGIEIKKGATARFSYCFVAFSTSGITAEDSTGIQLENCIFSVNGQWNFSLSGVITQVPDLQPFSYFPASHKRLVVSIPVIPSDSSVPVKVPPEKKARFHTRHILLGGVGVVLVAAGVATLYKSSRYRSEYNAYVPGNPSFNSAEPSARQAHFDGLRDRYNASAAIGFSAIGLALIDGVFLGITMRF